MRNINSFNIKRQLIRALYAYIAKEMFLKQEEEHVLKRKDLPKDFMVSRDQC